MVRGTAELRVGQDVHQGLGISETTPNMVEISVEVQSINEEDLERDRTSRLPLRY